MSKLTKYVIGIAIAAAVIFIVWYFSNIVTYILISAVLAIIGKPLVDAIGRVGIKGHKIPKWLAALITLAAIWTVAVLFFTLFIPLVFSKIGQLSGLDVEHILSSFHEPLARLESFITGFFSVNDGTFSLSDELAKQLSGVLNLDVVNSIVSSIVSIIGNTVVALFSITFITFFFLKEDNLFLNMILALFPNKYEQNVTHALNSITTLLIRYFTGILAESSIITILLSAAFISWGFSVETAIFMGLTMGVLNVIPYIGPLIGATICIIVGVLSPIDRKSVV